MPKTRASSTTPSVQRTQRRASKENAPSRLREGATHSRERVRACVEFRPTIRDHPIEGPPRSFNRAKPPREALFDARNRPRRPREAPFSPTNRACSPAKAPSNALDRCRRPSKALQRRAAVRNCPAEAMSRPQTLST